MVRRGQDEHDAGRGRADGARRRGPDIGRATVEATLYGISVAAEMAGMHAQTLRTYDRLGLVTPARTTGGVRRYSNHDVELLREVQRLSQDEGVNLAGIKRIIELSDEVEALHKQVDDLVHQLEHASRARHGELVPVPRTNALVVWQPRGKRAR